MARKRKKKEQAQQNGKATPEEVKETLTEAVETTTAETQPASSTTEATTLTTEPAAQEAPSGEEVNTLQQELEAARAEAQQNLEGWQRALAEFQNYKKRVERDRERMQQEVAGRVLTRYLEVLDDLERSLKEAPQDAQVATWVEGIELIYRKMLKILESEGVRPMDAEGQPFDPNLHEAISHEEAEGYESGQIIEVVRQGYLLGDRVLRPALVRVAR